MNTQLWLEQIRRIRTHLVYQYQSVASIFTSVQTTIVNGDICIQLDRKNNIYIGKRFFEEDLTFFKQVALYLKYHLHASLRHSSRSSMYSEVDKFYFELACELSINQSLRLDSNLDMDDLTMLKDVDENLAKEGLIIEELAARLKKMFPPDQGGIEVTLPSFGNQPGFSVVSTISNSIIENDEMKEQFWDNQMASYARDPNSPAVIKSLPVSQPQKASLTQQINQYFSRHFGGTIFRSNYQKPNKKQYSGCSRNGEFIPSRERVTLPDRKVVVCFDTSYSCWAEEVRQEFLSVLDDLIIRYRLNVDLVQFDAVVQKISPYTLGETVEFHGGGGTNFIPLFEPQLKSVQGETLDNINTSLMVLLTDLEGPAPSAPPEYQVLWILPPGYPHQPPFGDVIHGYQKGSTLVPSLR